MPKISFVMPERNRGAIIGKSIRSIIDQTEKDWELIVIDDHSSEEDNTEKIVNEFSDNRIKFVRMPKNWPHGIPNARNFGNMFATAPIIAVADSDDINMPRRAELTLKYFERESCDVFFGDYEIFREETNELADHKNKINIFKPEMLNEKNYIPHGSSAYTREIAYQYPYNSFFGKGEDYDFFVRLAKANKKFSFCKEIIFRYIKHTGNITRGSDLSAIDTLIKLNNDLEKHDRRKVLDNFIADVYK